MIVHDAARPLATPQLFERALASSSASRPRAGAPADAVIAAAPVTDTIKEVGEDGRTVSARWRARGCGRCRRRRSSAAPRWSARWRCSDAELARATDDAWLVERIGGVVHIVGSDPGNMKITTREDLRVAEMLLAERGS